MENLKMKYSDMYTLVPVDIKGQMQEVTQSLQQVEVKVHKMFYFNKVGAKLEN